jgi:hypothetical protein
MPLSGFCAKKPCFWGEFEVYYAQNPIPEASVAFIYREQYRCEHKDHAHDFLSNSE